MSHPLIEVAREALAAEPIAYQGVRKIINGMTWEPGAIFSGKSKSDGVSHKGRILPSAPLQFADLGYGTNKLKQLMRNYVNEEEFSRVRTVLDRRKDKGFTSVALSMRGAKKDVRSMGWCILSIVVTRSKDTEKVEVQYRSTELTLKFGGDLVFLPWVFGQLGVSLNSPVTFRFANCYISGVYLPYLVKFVRDPVSMLNDIRNLDPLFFASATRFFLRSSMKRDQFFPYSPENVAHKFGWDNLDSSAMKRIREYLTERHKEFGSLDWAKVHHVKSEYVPRAQRNEDD